MQWAAPCLPDTITSTLFAHCLNVVKHSLLVRMHTIVQRERDQMKYQALLMDLGSWKSWTVWILQLQLPPRVWQQLWHQSCHETLLRPASTIRDIRYTQKTQPVLDRLYRASFTLILFSRIKLKFSLRLRIKCRIYIANHFALDLAVSAPYEQSGDMTMNTGAVYIYYGTNTKENMRNQIPQRVSCVYPPKILVKAQKDFFVLHEQWTK